MPEATSAPTPPTQQLVSDVLATIDREREREIVSRRFGLFDRKETLEQIGELLGITRERVRQLEKAVLARLKESASKGDLPNINETQSSFRQAIAERGDIVRVTDLTSALTGNSQRTD